MVLANWKHDRTWCCHCGSCPRSWTRVPCRVQRRSARRQRRECRHHTPKELGPRIQQQPGLHVHPRPCWLTNMVLYRARPQRVSERCALQAMHMTQRPDPNEGHMRVIAVWFSTFHTQPLVHRFHVHFRGRLVAYCTVYISSQIRGPILHGRQDMTFFLHFCGVEKLHSADVAWRLHLICWGSWKRWSNPEHVKV